MSKGGAYVSDAAAVPQPVAGWRREEVPVAGISAVDQVIPVVHDNVINDQNPARVRRLDHLLQVGHAAPVRRHLVEIPRGVAVKLPVAIQHHGRNPNRGRAQRLDVVQLLLDPFEIPAVNRPAVGRAVVALGIVVGSIAVEEAVSDDLVDALALPELKVLLGARRNGRKDCRNEKTCRCDAGQALGTIVQSTSTLAAANSRSKRKMRILGKRLAGRGPGAVRAGRAIRIR